MLLWAISFLQIHTKRFTTRRETNGTEQCHLPIIPSRDEKKKRDQSTIDTTLNVEPLLYGERKEELSGVGRVTVTEETENQVKIEGHSQESRGQNTAHCDVEQSGYEKWNKELSGVARVKTTEGETKSG